MRDSKKRGYRDQKNLHHREEFECKDPGEPGQEEEKNDDDNNTADYYRCSSGAGNDDNTFSALPYFSGGKRTTGCDHISGDSAAVCSDRTAGGVLPERCSGKRPLWDTGTDCHFVYPGTA